MYGILTPKSTPLDFLESMNPKVRDNTLSLAAFLANSLVHCNKHQLDLRRDLKECCLCSRHICDYRISSRKYPAVVARHTCSDLAHCEPAVRIWSLCNHIVGARCFVRWIRDGNNICPECFCVLFKPTEKGERDMLLEESVLWNWCWGWDLGKRASEEPLPPLPKN